MDLGYDMRRLPRKEGVDVQEGRVVGRVCVGGYRCRGGGVNLRGVGDTIRPSIHSVGAQELSNRLVPGMFRMQREVEHANDPVIGTTRQPPRLDLLDLRVAQRPHEGAVRAPLRGPDTFPQQLEFLRYAPGQEGLDMV